MATLTLRKGDAGSLICLLAAKWSKIAPEVAYGDKLLLELEDGTIHFQSTPIAKFLSQKKGSAFQMIPKKAGDELDSIMIFAEKMMASPELVPAFLAAIEGKFMGEFLLGEFCLADVVVFALVKTFTPDLSAHPTLTAWYTTVLEMVKDDVAAFDKPAKEVYEMSPNAETPVYITTPIYYVNGEPHIGHVYTTLLADIATRYYKMKGTAGAYLLTGNDEHGQKVQQTAEAKGMTPKAMCDEISETFKDCFKVFNLQYDRFIRTTDDDHIHAAQTLWKKLADAGLIYKGEHDGWYCVSDETFVPDSSLGIRTLPDGTEERYSLESGHPCIAIKEVNYMFKLSEYGDRLAEYYEANPDVIVPEFRRKEIIKFLRGGLKDLSLSRPMSRISWAVPVPGDEEHGMYVWIDALTNYLTGAGYPDKLDTNKLWPATMHVLGKDIARFHCVYWPAFLLGAGLELPHKLVVHGWWTKDGMKISKSLGNAFDPYEAATRYGLDPLRFFLCRESNSSIDGDFSHNAMVDRLNIDLANDLGNLVNRVVSTALNPGRVVPAAGDVPEAEELIAALNALPGTVDHHMGEVNIQGALVAIWEVIGQTNAFIQDAEPWKLKAADQQARKEAIMYVATEAVRIVGTLLLPVMPETMARLLNEQLNVPAELMRVDLLKFAQLESGRALGDNTDILFDKLVDRQAAIRAGLVINDKVDDTSTCRRKAIAAEQVACKHYIYRKREKGLVNIEGTLDLTVTASECKVVLSISGNRTKKEEPSRFENLSVDGGLVVELNEEYPEGAAVAPKKAKKAAKQEGPSKKELKRQARAARKAKEAALAEEMAKVDVEEKKE
ncbi:Methionyl/Leucyl tRNA synthetase [Carpediemonas membranifera]|uniref:methionine--tRNA ligase n=1 Tax=Carpediemonas membranifera TaxID=201153 RepID=A0A8J6BYQ6_9EUKA|nr:Methionyl/Leucyl tRNA synthetase [Carpediemonas membranifera]|eukprot:KAG9394761.1 Methionyl/Leucyl tRNA synthetase [Carpediemonas membranifera]